MARLISTYDRSVTMTLASRWPRGSLTNQTFVKLLPGGSKGDGRKIFEALRTTRGSMSKAAVVDDCRETFGKVGKFGASVLLTPDISASDIGKFLEALDAEVAKPAIFSLPRTTVISE